MSRHRWVLDAGVSSNRVKVYICRCGADKRKRYVSNVNGTQYRWVNEYRRDSMCLWSDKCPPHE